MRDMCGLIQVSSDAPIPHCAGCQKMSVVRPVCLFFWCWVYPLQHQVHAEEKISLFILEDSLVGFHCFSGRPALCTGSARRGEEERLPFFSRRKMIDPRLSRCTSFVGALDASCYTGLLLSLRRLLLEHSVLSHCFPVLSCCVDELADLMLCAVCPRYGGKWAFSIVVAREEGQRVCMAARTASHSRRAISKWRDLAVQTHAR